MTLFDRRFRLSAPTVFSGHWFHAAGRLLHALSYRHRFRAAVAEAGDRKKCKSIVGDMEPGRRSGPLDDCLHPS